MIPRHFALISVVLVCACGGAGARPERAPSSAVAHPPEPEARHPALAPLRPPGSDEVLATLARDFTSPDAYARAAVFYSGTDAGGMTLLWGLTYTAMQPNGAAQPDVAAAMTRVLRERITVQAHDGSTRISTRLAPGATPGIARDDNTVWAPVVHIFELQLGRALATFDGTWTLPAAIAVCTTYASLLQQSPSLLDARVELETWLRSLAASGHAEAFSAIAFSTAFPGQLSAYEAAHPNAIAAARTWLAANPFGPTHPLMPDDLVRIH